MEPYNGYSNHETWLANLWLANDEASYNNLLRILKHELDCYEKADLLERSMRVLLDYYASEANLWLDLLSAAFGRIKWLEIIDAHEM
jgi:hypothetical protein